MTPDKPIAVSAQDGYGRALRCVYCDGASVREIESDGGLLIAMCDSPECLAEGLGDVEQDNERERKLVADER